MSRIIFFIVALAVWILLTWPPTHQELITGALVAALVALICGELFVRRLRLLLDPRRHLYFIFAYVPIFAWQCLKANFDVARRVLDPRLPIRPGIVKVRTRLRSDVAVTLLANSITLTPGTMTVDVDPAGGCLYVHWIDVESIDIEVATRQVVGRFEPVLLKIFE